MSYGGGEVFSRYPEAKLRIPDVEAIFLLEGAEEARCNATFDRNAFGSRANP